MPFCLVFALLFTALAAHSEESAACTSLRISVLNQPLFARDYSADTNRDYEMKAGALSSSEVKLREFATFTPEKVQCGGKTLTMEGTRRFAVLDSSSHTVSQTSTAARAKIEVAVSDESLETALPKMLALLFWSSSKQAVDSVPEYVAKFVPAVFDQVSKAYVDCAECGPGLPYAESQGLEELSRDSGVTPRV